MRGSVRRIDDDGYFGERIAASYDDSSAERFQPAHVDAVADVLAGLAGGGRALELGIGTGWTRQPFTSESRQHVSVWQKPAG